MSTATKMITLQSSDNENFEVDEKVARESLTIKRMIEDRGPNMAIPLPNVSGKILAKVMEYCKKHVESDEDKEKSPSAAAGDCSSSDDDASDDSLKTWDAEFLKVDHDTLFDIIEAAHYLNIKRLLGLTCQAVADSLTGKTTEAIRRTYNIRNDFTPDEEAEVRWANQWAFE